MNADSIALLCGGLLAAIGASPLAAQEPHEIASENRRCFECHGQEHIAELGPSERFSMVAPLEDGPTPAGTKAINTPSTRPELFIDEHGVFAKSMHQAVACVACHVDCTELPHAFRTQPARCDACHAEEFEQYAESAHGQGRADGDEAAATCSDCHGTHDIRSHLDPKSKSYILRQPLICAGCHAEADIRLPEAAAQYMDSVHGRGLLAGGLIVAPSCVDCHGVHEISQPDSDSFRLASDGRCGACHEDQLRFYRETFHGKAAALGNPDGAACFDCHGYHDIQPNDDPRSHLSADNKLATCQKCHTNAGGDFAGYLAHGNHSDSENYPALYWTFVVMAALVLGTFGFFGIHTILWTIRSMVLLMRNPRAFKDAKVKAVKDDEVYVRFSPFERFLHVIVIISFLTLVATGMPLKFYYAGWAKHVVGALGGIEATSRLHRFGACLTFLYFSLHLTSIARGFWRRRSELRNPKTGRVNPLRLVKMLFGPDMPAPHWTDLKDLWAHQKWFFGRGPRPQFDRWTYWEKFDYLAVFWGVGVIGVSGLVLWFPEFFTRFMPGWSINIATIVHSDEALLAAGFIFTFHFFNVHFRLEKFPIDPVIFSGRISRTEMLHERRKWFDRLEASGKLEDLRVKDEWNQWKQVVYPLGFLAFGIGLVLLGLILYATLIRLTGGGG